MKEDKKEMGLCVFLYLREIYEDKHILLPKEQRYGMSLQKQGIILTGVISS